MTPQEALAHLALGFALLPLYAPDPDHPGGCTCKNLRCSSPGKHPIPNLAPAGHRSATKDPDTVISWFEQLPFAPNIAVATGKKSGIVILDADGPSGVEHLVALDPPTTLAVVTPGKGGGIHLYFQHPGRRVAPRNRTVVHGLALDLLGDGSYALLPPSQHPEAPQPYRWLVDAPIAPFTPFLATLLEHAGSAERAAPFALPPIIPYGQRRRTMFRYACSLQAKGFQDGDILTMLQAALPKCEQPPAYPFTADEIQEVVDDVLGRYSKGTASQHDEFSLVRRIQAELDEPDARCVSVDGETYYFNRRCWRPLGIEGVATFLHGWSGESTTSGQNTVKSFKPTFRLIKGTHAHLQLLHYVPSFFDDAPEAAGFANGVLIPNGEFHAHSPDFRLRYCRNYDYDPNKPVEKWITFLDETFNNAIDKNFRIEALQEFAGVAMFGMATKLATAVILIGPGANGKSVILDVVSALLPPDAVVSVAPHEMTSEYARADLQLALLNVVTEMPLRELRDADAIKAMIDGSRLKGRPIYGKPIYTRSRCAHLFAANLLPDTADYTYSMRRRWIVLECPNIVPRERRDTSLAQDIIAEELLGVAAWAARGAARLLQRGHYQFVPSSEERLVEWAIDSNQVAQFVIDRLEQNGELTPLKVLRQEYTYWAAGNGWRPVSSTRLSQRLSELEGVEKFRRADGVYFNLSPKKLH